ncbi:MAG TPA: GNAT family N-acetyltransferase [Thermoanaerobaculia bacterium]|nr:GNAT family N-acetyltransferase [Thermoanaerobaculia bacterium]
MIRRATPADAAVLAELGERTFRAAFGAQNRPEDMDAYCARTYGETLQRRELEDANAVTLIVEENGVAVAFAYLRREESEFGDIYVSRFYIDAAWHGRGIAQSLMREVEAAARDLGGTKLWLSVWEHNPRAIAFYAKCGFTAEGTQPFLVGSDLQTDYILTRVISAT